jgi:hypothetical protein
VKLRMEGECGGWQRGMSEDGCNARVHGET